MVKRSIPALLCALAFAGAASSGLCQSSNALVPGQIAPYAPQRGGGHAASGDQASAPVSTPNGAYTPTAPGAPAQSESVSVKPSGPGYDYVLGSGDKLRVIVFGEENLSGEFIVAGNGHLSLPLIGEVPAAGKTVGQVRNEITAALADGYLKDPRVSAEVETFRPYYILGEVAKPGEYPYSNGITVMNAVATAGGFTYRANHKYVFIQKSQGQAEQRVRLTDTLTLAPGDTVRVLERYF